CHIAISYHGVVISIEGESHASEAVHELRYNTAIQARIHRILDQVRRHDLDPLAALDALEVAESSTPRHSRWLAALFLGVAAAGLAVLLGADSATSAVAGSAAALGLLARQELGRRHFSLLLLPLIAALIGSSLGGLAIRFHLSQT